jgi:hypothetical protein
MPSLINVDIATLGRGRGGHAMGAVLTRLVLRPNAGEEKLGQQVRELLSIPFRGCAGCLVLTRTHAHTAGQDGLAVKGRRG